MTPKRSAKRDWRRGNAERCEALTKGTGAGMSGPHRCSFTAICQANGRHVCASHLRQFLRGSMTIWRQGGRIGKPDLGLKKRKKINRVQNENAYALGKWSESSGMFEARRIVWGRLLAREEKRTDEVIKPVRISLK